MGSSKQPPALEKPRYIATKPFPVRFDRFNFGERQVRMLYDNQEGCLIGADYFAYGASRRTGNWMDMGQGYTMDVRCHLGEMKESGTFDAFLQSHTLTATDQPEDLPEWAREILANQDYDFNVIRF